MGRIQGRAGRSVQGERAAVVEGRAFLNPFPYQVLSSTPIGERDRL